MTARIGFFRKLLQLDEVLVFRFFVKIGFSLQWCIFVRHEFSFAKVSLETGFYEIHSSCKTCPKTRLSLFSHV
jgi:hypothetical protein